MHSISKKCLYALLMTVSMAPVYATEWSAGSTYKGTISVPIEGGNNVVWQCDGHTCRLSGPWGDDLSLDSCQNLVLRSGKITYYKNSAGKSWDANSPSLQACNRAAR